MCVSQESKNQHDDQKQRCSVVERKTMLRVEFRKLPVDSQPRACVVSMEELPGDSRDYRALFTRTFRTSSAEPDDAIMNVHVDLQEREGL